MVRFVRGDVYDRAGPDCAGTARYSGFELPGTKHDHFLMSMVMFGMRHLSGRELRQMQVDLRAFVRFAIEYLSRFVVVVRIGLLGKGLV